MVGIGSFCPFVTLGIDKVKSFLYLFQSDAASADVVLFFREIRVFYQTGQCAGLFRVKPDVDEAGSSGLVRA